MRKAFKWIFIVLLAIIAIVLIMPHPASAKSDEVIAQELKEQIRKLEQEKAQLGKEGQARQDKNKPTGKRLEELTSQWETLLADCTAAGKKSNRCSDALYNLGRLSYDKARDDYIQKREQYEKAMDAFEKNGRGTEPVNPAPDYSKTLKYYERLIKEYPEYPQLSEVYYQTGNIYLIMGDLDGCAKAFTKITESYPKSPRASMAHFRLSDLAYLDHDNTETIKHLEKVVEAETDIETWEMVHYRKGEIYYNMGDFDKAINLFYSYVERCDQGIYKKAQFREMALEFMSICFSDMPDGGEEAIKFFKKIGKKPYEGFVMYTIGMKNRTHGQWDDAIKSLQVALKNYPFYKSAPLARQMLIECFIVKKDIEKANNERERLVDDYGPKSAWYSKNSGEKSVIEQSRNETNKALASLALYNHAMAQKSKDKNMYQKSIKRYEDFFKEFPEDVWRIYEFKYNIAEIYGALGDCKKAAENYDYVATQDMTKFPSFKREIDTLGMDQDQAEKMKSEKGVSLISQEDAGYNVVVALDNCRKKAMAAGGIAPDQAYALPETKQLLDYSDKFQVRFPKSPNAPEVLFIAGSIHFSAKSYDNAILVFKKIISSYPSSPMYDKSQRMLANCYSSTGQFDGAMAIYRQLIGKQKAGTPEHEEVVDLAAGAIFKKAEGISKAGDLTGAALAFKDINREFPSSKVADRGWFEAGVCYEKLKNYDAAAETFEKLAVTFPKSTLREKAFLRAADNYKTNNKLEKAAQVYQHASEAITKAEFAIPSLSAASECYQKLNQFQMAGSMFEIIYERYASDPKTPQALYNAGLIFEKGKLYANAITVYSTLASRFPQSEYAAEALFSVGLCYEKMGQFSDMAGAFANFAVKFQDDHLKQVQALTKAGNAYFNMDNMREAEKNYAMAVAIYDKFHKSSDIDVGNIAEAYFKIGEIYYRKFQQIKLTARSEREMKALSADKSKALEEADKQYAKAIEIGVEEWTIRATFMIGQGFVEMAEAMSGQSLFGSPAERIASKIKILSSLEKYYLKTREYFYKNIEWAHTQNISNEYIDKSSDRFMEMMYRLGDIFEEMGRILQKAPIPSNLSADEKVTYQELLDEKFLEAQEKSLPHYREAIKAAQELGIAQNQWLEKSKDRIKEIAPDDSSLTIQIVQWQPGTTPTQSTLGISGSSASGSKGKTGAASPEAAAGANPDLVRALKRMQNIMNMNISLEDKIKQLNRIEIDANREITLEQEKIVEMKKLLNM